MSKRNRGYQYDEDFKRTIVNLYYNGGKTHSALYQEYVMSLTILSPRIKQYTTVETDNS